MDLIVLILMSVGGRAFQRQENVLANIECYCEIVWGYDMPRA